jgi:LysR family glycine cleavage system transcriptional activator
MDSAGPRLPPLPAVRVFEAVARNLSFTKAAAELGVTQAAVSYQIKLLEDRIGTALFQRLTRKLALTEMGLRLASPVSEALGLLAEAFGSVETEVNSALRIAVNYTFATNWLVPRLNRFTQAHPQFSIILDTFPGTIDFASEHSDIGILAGRGDWPSLVADRLMPNRLTPLVSPGLLALIGGAEEPLDLLKLPLLREIGNYWNRWFELTGNEVPPGVVWGPLLDTRQIMGRAAIEGQGVALLAPSLFVDEIASGQLVQPFPQLLESEWEYYLVYAKSRQRQPKVRAFRGWIMGELLGDGIGAARSGHAAQR